MSFSPKQLARKLWWDFLITKWPVYLAGTLAVALTNVTVVLWTRGIGWFIDFFSGKEIPAWLMRGTQLDTFYWLFILLFSARFLLFVGRIGWRITIARQSHFAGGMLRAKVYQHARFFKKRALDTDFTKGVLMNASTSDVNAARFIFGFTLVAMVDVIFLGTMTVWAMFKIHAGMTLWSLTALLVIPFFVKKISSMEIDRYRLAQDYLSTFNDLASQVVSTIRLQRLTQTGEFWRRRLMETADSYREKRLKAIYSGLAYSPVMGGAAILSYLILFLLGINYVLQGAMTVGEFVSMQGLIFLLQDPLFELGFIISDWQKGGSSLERLAEIYVQPEEPWLRQPQTHSVQPINEILATEKLSFAYGTDSAPIFKDLNLKIDQGDRLGIKGPIGAGKSTLVSVLSGLERNHQGQLRFLGKDYSEFSHQDLRRQIGLVPQKPFLFAATIRENIEMDEKLSDEQIWHYLEVAGLADDVKRFPNQLETPLGEWGINLSGGQKQRLTLARAIARKPQLLFLDDCLSAVDTVTEEKILTNLNQELAGTTLVWVAHRDSTLKYCDRVFELQKEDISDVQTH